MKRSAARSENNFGDSYFVGTLLRLTNQNRDLKSGCTGKGDRRRPTRTARGENADCISGAMVIFATE